LTTEPIPAAFDAPIVASMRFCVDCEFRDQLSSTDVSAGFATVLLISGEFAPTRWDDGNSGSRVELGRKELFPERPIVAPLLLLLFALASQAAAQSSTADADRAVEGDDDGCAQLDEELELDCPPR
jgi:hypothetical protein